MKRIFKKGISVFLVVAMLLCAAPLNGFVGFNLPSLFHFNAAAEVVSGTCGENLTWTYDTESRVLKISGTGPMTDWKSNSDAPWHSYYNYVKKIEFGSGVTTIGKYAFYCFYALTSVKIPDNITTIGSEAFACCNYLTEVTLGNGLVSIGDTAFRACSRLKSITIPENVESIESESFTGCSALTEIKVDPNNQYFSSDSYGVLFNKDKTQLIHYPAGNKRQSYEVPVGVTSIGDDAFSNCDNLVNVIISEGVTTLGWSAFSLCDNLTNLTIPVSLKSIGFLAFNYSRKLTNVYYGGDITDWLNLSFYEGLDKRESNPMCYAKNFYSKGKLVTNLVIPEGTTIVHAFKFYNWDCVRTVTIPDSVTSIDRYSFYGCDNLFSISMPDSVAFIGEYAFYGCNSLSKVLYSGNKSSFDSITMNSYNQPLRNAEKYYGLYEEFNHFSMVPIKSNKGFYVPVKAYKAETQELISAAGAVVEIKFGNTVVCTSQTDETGIAYFEYDSIPNRYSSFTTISAYLPLGEGLQLRSEKVGGNGIWYPAKLEYFLEVGEPLVVDEPRWYLPTLKVMVDLPSLVSCYNQLKGFSSDFAQSTNGHVVANDFDILSVPVHYTLFKTDTLKQIAYENNVNICMVSSLNAGAWSDIWFSNLAIKGSLTSVTGGYYWGGIIWCPSSFNSSKTLCHEAGHYLFGFGDEYASAIGAFGSENNQWQIKNKNHNKLYVYDTDQDGFIQDCEKFDAYWDKRPGLLDSTGSIKRPDYAPKNFGLMETQSLDIEMSNVLTYIGIDSDDPFDCTMHYYYTQASCEEKMAYVLDCKAQEYGYATRYDNSTQKQTATYSYAGGDNVTFNYDYKFLENSDQLILNSDNYSQTPVWYNDICSFDYFDSQLIINSKYDINITIRDIEESFVSSFVLNKTNDYRYSFETKDDLYYITVDCDIDGVSYQNQYSVIIETIDSGLDFSTEHKVVNLYADTEGKALIISPYNNEKTVNGEYVSLMSEYMICSEKDKNAAGGFSTTIGYNLDIDYSTLTWFYKTDSEWVAIETTVGTAEHGEVTADCSYVGDGTYCLMAKCASDAPCATPTDLLVTNTNAIYDNDVIVTFTNSNENTLYYNIYYGSEPISADNCGDMELCVAKSPYATISLEDSETTYYFAVEAVGNDGGKSELSECVACKGAVIDSDSDGLPDYWLSEYSALLEVENIAEVDSDEDGLTNLQEYENNTNPLNPDTDGDNVYDGMEIVYMLNPLEPMSDGETDDYIAVYGEPDVSINSSSFAIVDNAVTCSIENNADGKGMRTTISIYDASGELLELYEVNLNSESSVDFEFSKDYLAEGMRIVIDEDKITRDSDYSNNEFVLSPATAISATETDYTLVKSTNEQLKFNYYPVDATDIFTWKSSNENVVTVDSNGVITGQDMGTATVTVTTFLGYSFSYNIIVEPIKGAGLIDFNCQLINNDTGVRITKYLGDENVVVIPKTIGNVEVVSVGASAFSNKRNITSVSLPSGITSIASLAFNNCSNLKDVYYDGSRYCFNQINISSLGNTKLKKATLHCSVIPTTAKNNAVLDDESGLIYGLNAGIDSLEDYTNIELDGYHWDYTPTKYGFGTGTTALLTNGEKIMDGYTVVIFGDIQGDGWYDGEDAFLVNLIVNGMLDKDDVGEAIWAAADCNHDGVIDEWDVDLLSGAGLLLNRIDQTKPVEELVLNSDYIEYVMLIDQSAAMSVEPDVDNSQQGTTDTNTTPEQSADEINIEAILTNIFEFLKKIFNFIFLFVIK